MNERFRRVIEMPIRKGPKTRTITFEGEVVDIPTTMLRATYRDRRKRMGLSHEEAISR